MHSVATIACAAAAPGSGAFRRRRRLLLAFALLVTDATGAAAFPFLDATNQDQVPTGTELSSPDTQDLLHQLQLANGLSPPAGGGWTIVPRINVQEELTDNVLQLNSPRQADLVTYLSPGVSIAGDLPRVQMTFDFAPVLALYANETSLNALTEQMTGLASVTVVPDLFYVDVRGLSGVQSVYGGLGGVGTLGAPANANLMAPGSVPSLAGNTLGLTRDNEYQTSSLAISPYLLRRLGDWGTLKLGYSLAMTRSDTLSGFAASPLPSGGLNAQSLLTNEAIAHYDTGDALTSAKNSVDVNLTQSQSTFGGVYPPGGGLPAAGGTNFSSTSNIISDTLTYQLNRTVALLGSIGHEDITYTETGFQGIHDMTWSFGTTLTPNPDTALTVSYGHQYGTNSLAVTGHYAATARTVLNVSYGTTLGTQLQMVQSQLNLAAAGANRSLINAQTGGSLFATTNALAPQDGVFRTTSLVLGTQTTLDRDIISLNLLLASQSSTGAGPAFATSDQTISVSWVHQMRPDMTVSGGLSLSWMSQPAQVGFIPGNSLSAVATAAWQYQITETLGASISYSFFERQSAVTSYNMYQNMLILGLSKTF